MGQLSVVEILRGKQLAEFLNCHEGSYNEGLLREGNRGCKESIRDLEDEFVDVDTSRRIVLEMAACGTIDRVRQCENPKCRKWIMVTSTNRVTCSDACRFAKYEQSVIVPRQEQARANRCTARDRRRRDDSSLRSMPA